MIPETAVASHIRFVPEFSEVYISALKPGLVIGKGGSLLKNIASQTGWTPKMLRTPTMSSATIDGIRSLMFSESDFRKKFMTGVGKNINKFVKGTEWIKATALGGYREVAGLPARLRRPTRRS